MSKRDCYTNCVNSIFKGAIAENKRKQLQSEPSIEPITDVKSDAIFKINKSTLTSDAKLIQTGITTANYTRSLLSQYIPEYLVNSVDDTELYTVSHNGDNIYFIPAIPKSIEDFIDSAINKKGSNRLGSRYSSSTTNSDALTNMMNTSKDKIEFDRQTGVYYYKDKANKYRIDNRVSDIVHYDTRDQDITTIANVRAALLLGDDMDAIVRSLNYKNRTLENKTSNNITVGDGFINKLFNVLNNNPTFQAHGGIEDIYTKEQFLHLAGIQQAGGIRTGLAGTMDMIVKTKDGQAHLVDIKTHKNQDISKESWENYIKQQSLYYYLALANGVKFASTNILSIQLDYDFTSQRVGNDLNIIFSKTLDDSNIKNIELKSIIPEHQFIEPFSVTSLQDASNYNINRQFGKGDVFQSYRQYIQTMLDKQHNAFKHFKKIHSSDEEDYFSEIERHLQEIRRLQDTLEQMNEYNIGRFINDELNRLEKILDPFKTLSEKEFEDFFLDERLSILSSFAKFANSVELEKDKYNRDIFQRIFGLRQALIDKRIDYVLSALHKISPAVRKLDNIKENGTPDERQKALEKIDEIEQIVREELEKGGESGFFSSRFLGAYSGNGTIGQMIGLLKDHHLTVERGVDSSAIIRLKAQQKAYEEQNGKDYDFLYGKNSYGKRNGYLISKYNSQAFDVAKEAYLKIKNYNSNRNGRISKDELMNFLKENFEFKKFLSDPIIRELLTLRFNRNEHTVIDKLLNSYPVSTIGDPIQGAIPDTMSISEKERNKFMNSIYEYFITTGNLDILDTLMAINDYKSNQNNDINFDTLNYLPLIPKEEKFVNEDYKNLNNQQREIVSTVEEILDSINQTYNNNDNMLIHFLQTAAFQIKNGIISQEFDKRFEKFKANFGRKLIRTMSLANSSSDVPIDFQNKILKKDGSINAHYARKMLTDALRQVPYIKLMEIVKDNGYVVETKDNNGNVIKRELPEEMRFSTYIEQRIIDSDMIVEDIDDDRLTIKAINGVTDDIDKEVRSFKRGYKNYLINTFLDNIMYTFMDTGDPIGDVLFASELAADYRAREQTKIFANQIRYILQEKKQRSSTQENRELPTIQYNQRYTLDWVDTYIARNIEGDVRARDKKFNREGKLRKLFPWRYQTNIQKYAEQLYEIAQENIDQENEFKIKVVDEDENSGVGVEREYRYHFDGNNNYTRFEYQDGKEVDTPISKEEYETALKDYCLEVTENLYSIISPGTFIDAITSTYAQKALALNLKSGERNRIEGYFKNLLNAASEELGYNEQNLADAMYLLKGVNVFRKEYIIREKLQEAYADKHSNFLKTYLMLIDSLDLFQSHAAEGRAGENIAFSSSFSEFLTNWATNDPEAKNQGQAIMAILLNSKARYIDKNGNWQEVDFIKRDENGKPTDEFTLYKPGLFELKDEFKDKDGINESLWIKFKDYGSTDVSTTLSTKIKTAVQRIHGNYNSGDRPFFKSNALLSAAMLFHTYLPEHIYQEYGYQQVDLITGKTDIRGRKRELFHHLPYLASYITASSIATNLDLNAANLFTEGVIETKFLSVVDKVLNNLGFFGIGSIGIFAALKTIKKIRTNKAQKDTIVTAFKEEQKDYRRRLGLVDLTIKDHIAQFFDLLAESGIRTVETGILTATHMASLFPGVQLSYGMPFSRKYVDWVNSLGIKNMTQDQRKKISENAQSLANFLNIKAIGSTLLSLYDLLIIALKEAGDDDDKSNLEKDALEALCTLLQMRANYTNNTMRMLTSDITKYSNPKDLANDATVLYLYETYKRAAKWVDKEGYYKIFWYMNDYTAAEGIPAAISAMKIDPFTPARILPNTAWNMMEDVGLSIANGQGILTTVATPVGELIGDRKVYTTSGMKKETWDERPTEVNYYEGLWHTKQPLIKEKVKDEIKERLRKERGMSRREVYQYLQDHDVDKKLNNTVKKFSNYNGKKVSYETFYRAYFWTPEKTESSIRDYATAIMNTMDMEVEK